MRTLDGLDEDPIRACLPRDPTRSSTSGSSSDTAEAFYSSTTEQLIVYLLDVVLLNSSGEEELTQYTEVTMTLAPECAGTSLRMTGLTPFQ